MKFLTVIFGIYILALSVMPCGDTYNAYKTNTVLTENSQSHSHDSDHNDQCSPFCTCACCSISSSSKLAPLNIKITKPEVVSKLTFPHQNFSLVSNYYGNIWQPPRINV